MLSGLVIFQEHLLAVRSHRSACASHMRQETRLRPVIQSTKRVANAVGFFLSCSTCVYRLANMLDTT